MSQLTELHTNEELNQALVSSTESPIFIFKQSTTCPISATAFDEYKAFLETADVPAYFVKVRETREVSNQIAEETNV